MREILLAKWADVRSNLLETLEKFADHELLYRPFPEGYSVVETLLHLAHEEQIEVGWGITRRLAEMPGAYEADLYPSKAPLIALLVEVHSHTIEHVSGLEEEDFGRDLQMPWGVSFGHGSALLHVLEHEIHHRGELSLMLGLLGRQGLDA